MDGYYSESIELLSGVPLGRVLGPLLFVIYINDLCAILSPGITAKLFADDAKLYTEIQTAEGIDKLQMCFDNLSSWANEWQLNISISKCSSIDIGNNNDYSCDNMFDGEMLNSLSELKDVSIIIDKKLTFSSHITDVVAKAKQRIFLLFRAFHTHDRVPLLTAYNSFILPLLIIVLLFGRHIYWAIFMRWNLFNVYLLAKLLVLKRCLIQRDYRF